MTSQRIYFYKVSILTIILESVAASALVAEGSVTLRKTNDSQFPQG